MGIGTSLNIKRQSIWYDKIMNKNVLKWLIFAGLFAVPFIPFLVSSSFFFPFITTKAFVWRIIVEVIFAAWVLLALLDSDSRPKKSPILYAVAGFIALIGIANLFGVAPIKSFWSNYERMEGFISLLHLGAFFLVIGSVFKEVDWKRWWNTSLVASALMVVYALFQVLGIITPSQFNVRVDGTFGNAIYLAVYMLFHIFIALLFMYRERRNKILRSLYGLLIFFQIVVLYYTATRGAILGLLGGLFILALLNLRNREEPAVRKFGVAIVAGLIILVGGFWLLRNAEFVQTNPVLSRFATLNVTDLKTQGRYFIWPMALKGIAERPVLGWGQDNFNYIFQKHYTPEMYILEPWFDRAHNIFLDWAVVGGIVGLISYLLLYAVSLRLVWFRAASFSATEKSILVSLIAAYAFHNFFVFDHLVSYILFFSLLSYLYSRLAATGPLWSSSMPEAVVKNMVAPAVVVFLSFSLYFVNVKPIIANTSLIKVLRSLQAGQPALAVDNFEKAYKTARLGRPEVAEQLSVYSIALLTSSLSVEEKNRFFAFARNAMLKEAGNQSRDAKYQMILGSFLATTGSTNEGVTYLLRAHELAPNKQQIYLELANGYLLNGDQGKAVEVLQELAKISPAHRAEVEGYIKQIQK